ncbi:MAG: exo-alpha-sialidase [Planctomycetota bacterium]
MPVLTISTALALAIGAFNAQSAPSAGNAAPAQSTPDATTPKAAPPADPRMHQRVRIERVASDGTTQPLAEFQGADVASVARLDDGRIAVAYQAFPADDARHFDRVAVRFSSDEGRSFTDATPVTIDGMDAGLAPAFDPTLVALPDGRVRLYFISYAQADTKPGGAAPATAVHSAISSDGLHYTYEPGVRFAVEGRVTVDAAAALHDGVFHLVVPDNGTPGEFLAARKRGQPPAGGNGYHAVSRDGLAFTRAADLPLASTSNRWWGNLLSDGGNLLFLGTGPGPWPLSSHDGLAWKIAEKPLALKGVDPSALRLRDGALLVAWTEEASSPKSTADSTARPATKESPEEGVKKGVENSMEKSMDKGTENGTSQNTTTPAPSSAESASSPPSATPRHHAATNAPTRAPRATEQLDG